MSGPTFDVTVHADSIAYLDGSGHSLSVTWLEVRDRSSGISQHITAPDTVLVGTWIDPGLVVRIEDVNFDGHADFRLLSWLSTSHYTQYWYWLFDPTISLFVRDTTMDEFMNPSFDQERKWVKTWWRVGFEDFGAERYTYDPDGALQLIARQHLLIDPQTYEDGYVTIQRRENGKLSKEEFEVKGEAMEAYSMPWEF